MLRSKEGLTLPTAAPRRSLCSSLPCSATDRSPARQYPVSNLYEGHLVINDIFSMVFWPWYGQPLNL